MAVVATLDVILAASTKRFEKGMKRARFAISGLTGALGGLGVSLGVGGIFAKATQSANDFQVAMTNSLAIMGDVSDTMRTEMVSAAQQMASQTRFSAKEGADAYFFLASAGFSAEQSIASLNTVAKFGQAGNFDLATATDLLTDAQSALGLTVSDATENMRNMTRVGDVLTKANTIANATVEQFSRSLTNKAGPALRNVNKSLEEGVAVLAVFADQGIKGEQAGTALAIVLRELQTAAIKNAKTWQGWNLSVFDSQGKMRNVANIIRDLNAKFSRMTDEQKKMTVAQLGFTDKSFGFIQSLLGQEDAIRKYQRELMNAGGTMEEVADKQLTPFMKKVNELKSVFETFSIEVFTPILDSLGDAESGANDFATALAKVADVVHTIRLGWLGVVAQSKKALADAAFFGQFLPDAGAQALIRAGGGVNGLRRDAQAPDKQFTDAFLQDTPGQKFLQKIEEQQAQKLRDIADKEEQGNKEAIKQTKALNDIRRNTRNNVTLSPIPGGL